jgi:hypothetical protein
MYTAKSETGIAIEAVAGLARHKSRNVAQKFARKADQLERAPSKNLALVYCRRRGRGVGRTAAGPKVTGMRALRARLIPLSLSHRRPLCHLPSERLCASIAAPVRFEWQSQLLRITAIIDAIPGPRRRHCLTPRRPRSVSDRRNWVQNGSASKGRGAMPRTSRRPPAFAPTARSFGRLWALLANMGPIRHLGRAGARSSVAALRPDLVRVRSRQWSHPGHSHR